MAAQNPLEVGEKVRVFQGQPYSEKNTTQMAMQFISVKDALPQKECWCLVWAPHYWGTAARGTPYGYVFTKFRPNYKIHWGIESCQSKPVVEMWMELPEDPSF